MAGVGAVVVFFFYTVRAGGKMIVVGGVAGVEMEWEGLNAFSHGFEEVFDGREGFGVRSTTYVCTYITQHDTIDVSAAHMYIA
jgi:hypothetical protein